MIMMCSHSTLGFALGTAPVPNGRRLARTQTGPRLGVARPEAAALLSLLHSLATPCYASTALAALEGGRARRRVRRGERTLGARLLAATLKWGVDHAGDSAILAFTSPGAFRTLYDWRESCYGAPGQLTTALEDAALKLQQHVALSCDLTGAVRVEHRAKGLLSTFSKVGRGKKPRDILAVRLLLPGRDERACYDAMRAVHRLWRPTGRDYKDYVAAPKDNGYQSLHDTVSLPCGRLMEVQIRTASMHRHAERGAASHAHYKGSVGRLAGAIGRLSFA